MKHTRGGEMLKPNVSYCKDNNDVHYNPYEPNKIITYKAPAKLTETTSDKSTGSLNTAKFNTSVVSHTYKDGVGTIEFADDVTEIRDCAFASTSITEIQLPSTLISIGADTFLGVSAFGNCKSLTSVAIPNSVTSIGTNAFSACSHLTSVTIGNSVTSIGSSAFSNCTSLTSVAIPSSVTSIDTSAFGHCTNLTSVTISDGVTSIGSSAFSNCTSLTSVAIPSSVTSIGSSAFSACSHLTSVTIGNSVTSIGGSAFSSCSSLTSVTVEATTPPALGTSSFPGNGNFKIYVPAASVEAYKAASGWSNYTSDIEAIPAA